MVASLENVERDTLMSRCQIVTLKTNGQTRIQGNGQPLSQKAVAAIDEVISAIKQQMKEGNGENNNRNRKRQNQRNS